MSDKPVEKVAGYVDASQQWIDALPGRADEPPFNADERDWEAEAEGTAVERMRRLREAADEPPLIAAPTAEPYACRCDTPDVDTDGACCTCRRLVVTPEVAEKHGASRCDSCGEYAIDLHRVARRNGHAYWCWDCWEIWAEEAS